MKKLPLFIISLMASLAIGITTARAQVFYSLEDLGVVKGMQAAEPAALNNLAHVAGTAYKGVDTCAFHYDYLNKFMEDAGGVNSRGFGISSLGIVVGDSFFYPGPMDAGSHAAMFKGGYVVDLGVLKGQRFSRANGINAIGQVVGYSGPQRDSTESKAFFWTGQTGMRDLGTLGGAYAQAYAINDAGYITGTSETTAAIKTTHAFIYRPFSVTSGPMRDLGVLGGHSSYGLAINANNHVVGYSTVKPNPAPAKPADSTNERVHAFLHNGKSMIDLGSLGWPGTDTDASVALGVNNLDQVVGYSFLPAVGGMPLQQVAFIWRPNRAGGQMIDLNQLLLWNTRKNYLLVSATAINDNGQIVASAYDLQNGGIRAVLLTLQGPVEH